MKVEKLPVGGMTFELELERLKTWEVSERGLAVGVLLADGVAACETLGELTVVVVPGGRSACIDAVMRRLVVPVALVLPERAEQTRATRLPVSRKVLPRPGCIALSEREREREQVSVELLEYVSSPTDGKGQRLE